MTILTYIALSATLSGLAIGISTLLGENGYGFDLRGRKARRATKDGRDGGRRENDLLTA